MIFVHQANIIVQVDTGAHLKDILVAMNFRSAFVVILLSPMFLLLLVNGASTPISTRAGVNCPCPLDSFGDTGVPINVFPYFECAYPDGTCDWNMDNAELENNAQRNCPSSVSCDGSCACPLDLNNGTGALINIGQATQCAYANGACTFNEAGFLMNAIGQSNCPASSGC